MPKTFIGTSEIKKVFVGASQIKKIWVGTDLVFQSRVYLIKDGVPRVDWSTFAGKYTNDGGQSNRIAKAPSITSGNPRVVGMSDATSGKSHDGAYISEDLQSIAAGGGFKKLYFDVRRYVSTADATGVIETKVLTGIKNLASTSVYVLNPCITYDEIGRTHGNDSSRVTLSYDIPTSGSWGAIIGLTKYQGRVCSVDVYNVWLE